MHNIFLQIGAEMGIIGLVIFLWLILSIYREGLNYIKLNQGLMVNIIIGLLGGITAFLIHGLFDAASIGSKLFLFLWLVSQLHFVDDKFMTKWIIVSSKGFKHPFSKFRVFL